MGFHSDLGHLMHQLADKNKRNNQKGFAAGDRVSTPDGTGIIIKETVNLYLMRPGAAYAVRLDDGREADYNENDLKEID